MHARAAPFALWIAVIGPGCAEPQRRSDAAIVAVTPGPPTTAIASTSAAVPRASKLDVVLTDEAGRLPRTTIDETPFTPCLRSAPGAAPGFALYRVTLSSEMRARGVETLEHEGLSRDLLRCLEGRVKELVFLESGPWVRLLYISAP